MKNAASNSPPANHSDHLIQSPSPFSVTASNTTSMTAVITPPPNSNGGRLNEKVDPTQNTDEAKITFADDDGTWRKHGKLLRSGIILADEESGGNMFALSDSCAIERYYRVADRVLEQFLSSNIAERNELIECYIVGNRLFKFLSVVLPTHHQYFSTDQRLEKLRSCSESQLMELLEYMEELELMIDEMEYNRYILKDLTPSEAKDSGDISGHELQREEAVGDGDGFHIIKRRNDRKDDDAGKQGKPALFKQENHLQRNRVHGLDQRNDSSVKIFGGNTNVASQPSEASNRRKKNSTANKFDSQKHDEILKQRVAAVVKASSKVENSVNSHRPAQSTFCAATFCAAKPGSFNSPNTENNCFDSFPDLSSIEFQDFSQKGSEQHGLFQDTLSPSGRVKVKNDSSEQGRHEKVMHPLGESLEDSHMSWDADFSQFNVFSSGKLNGDDFLDSKPTSNIDLIAHDHWSRGGKKPLPKIKQPPVPYPRSVWGHAQVHAARLSSSFEGHELDENEHGMVIRSRLSDGSSDIFYALEDAISKPGPVKTRIEERLERASRDAPSSDKVSFAIYENSSVLESNSHRKLLNQFRGCVRFLLD